MSTGAAMGAPHSCVTPAAASRSHRGSAAVAMLAWRGTAAALFAARGLPCVAAAEGVLSRCYAQYDASRWDEGMVCPGVCPYEAACPGPKGTEKVSLCAKAADCSKLVARAHAIVQTSRCAECNVSGCAVCSAVNNCTACADQYVRQEDGTCRWVHIQLMTIATCAATILVIWIMFDIICTACRPTTNNKAIRAGLRARFRSQVRQLWKPNNPLFPITVDMHRHTPNVAPVCGPGMTLFMNWFCLLMVIGAWLSIGAWAFAPSEAENALIVAPCRNAIPQNATDRDIELDVIPRRLRNHTRWAIWNYVGPLIFSAMFLIWQMRLWSKLMNDSSAVKSLRKFCVRLSGFPAEATDKAAIEDFVRKELVFRHLPPEALRYISVAYSFTPEQGTQLMAALDENLVQAKERFYARNPQMSNPELVPEESSDSSDEDGFTKDPGFFWVRVMAYLMCGAPMECCGWTSEEGNAHDSVDPQDPEEVSELVNSLDNSGYVYAVFETEPIAVGFASIGCCDNKWDLSRSPEDACTIFVKRSSVDPPEIRWQDFHTDSRRTRCWRIMQAIAMIVTIQLIWFLLYGMFVEYNLDVLKCESIVDMLMTLILSGGIVLGNCLVANTVQKVTEIIGFKERPNMLICQLVLTVMLVTITCWGDVYVVRKAAEVNQAGVSWVHDAIDDMFRYLQPFDAYPTPMAASLQMDILAVLVPGYVILPYLGEPLFTIFVPLLMGILRIKGDQRITPEKAERILLPAEIEVVNPPYGDMITTTATILWTFWVSPGHYHKTLFPFMVAFALVLYLQMRFRILRVHVYTYFGNRRINDVESALWAFPLGVLAAALDRELTMETTWGIRGFAIHVILHLLFVRFVLPTFALPRTSCGETYTQIRASMKANGSSMAFANYENVNPVEVLKSEQQVALHARKEPLVYWTPAQAYLQPGCSSVGFEAEEDFENAMTKGHSKWNLVKVSLLGGKDIAFASDSNSSLEEDDTE